MDPCRNTAFCGRETASLEDTDSVHMPEMIFTFQHQPTQFIPQRYCINITIHNALQQFSQTPF